jgi:hypothetical protein
VTRELRMRRATLLKEELVLPVFPSRTAQKSWRFSTRGVAVRLFATCWLIYGLHFATNTVREVYPALSLGDHLSFNVYEYAGLHPDIFEIPGRGYFINSNPGASIVGAIPYAIFRPAIDRIVARSQQSRATSQATDQTTYNSPYPMAQEFYRNARSRGYDVKFGLAAGVMQIFGMAPISAASAVLMFYILLSLRLSTRQAIILTLLYAFATPVFYRTATLNQNLLVGHCAFFAFALLWHPWSSNLKRRPLNYLFAGLLSGWAVVLDYSGIIVPIVIGAYAVARRAKSRGGQPSKSDLGLFAVGVGLCAILLLGYQLVSFGNPLYPAQRYMPATPLSVFGYNGMDRPHFDLLWDTAFSLRFGLFASAPLLLLAFWVPAWLEKGKRLTGKLETWTIFAFTILFFLFCSANQFGRLQFNTGVRYIVPVVPFLFLIVAGVFIRLPKIAAVLLAIFATYWSWCLAMYRDVELGLGVLEPIKQITLQGFQLPWLTTLERMGYLANGASVVPLFVISAAVLTALWTVGGKRRQLAESSENS